MLNFQELKWKYETEKLKEHIFVQLEQNLLQTVIFQTKLKSVDVYWSDLRSIPYFWVNMVFFFSIEMIRLQRTQTS